MVTNERFKRLSALILVLANCFSAGSTAHAGDWMPMLPNQDFYDFQLFSPPDLQEYEIYPEPSEGIFFNYDRLYWGITPPRVTGVGTTQAGNYIIPTSPISPQTVVQLNNANITASGTSGSGSIIGGLYTFGSDPLALDLNTSWMRTRMGWGNRYEGGWIYDNSGINISYFSVAQDQSFQTNSEFAASSPTQTFTQNTASGGTGGGLGAVSVPLVTTTITSESPPPDHLIAQKLTQDNSVEIQSVGAAAIIRRELGKRGSGTTARFGLGPRFMQFAERYKLGYESNQYPFNVGGGAGGTTGGGTTGGGTTGGGQQGGGGLQAGGGQQQGGGQLGGGQQAGGLGGGSQLIGGGNIQESFGTGPAGDVLGITGIDSLTGQGLGTALQTGAWETYTSNNMVGPEFSLQFEAQQGRWLFSSEFKFTAGFNWQNNIYRGSNFPNSLGADYLRATFTPATTFTNGGTDGAGNPLPPQQINAPPLFLQIYGVGQNNATNSAEHRFVFTPIGEWRFGTQFRVSEAIRLHAGYTGMWLGSIARASTNTGYITKEKTVKFASPQDPTKPAGLDNPWVVKTSGPNAENRPVVDGRANPYYVPNPEFNSVGPVSGGQEYVLTNGLDFGIEVRY
jgi:hypothetical protein